jgi:hypothetical protein
MRPKSALRNEFFDALVTLKIAVAKVESCGDLSGPEYDALSAVLKALRVGFLSQEAGGEVADE